jgi:hypothetical protein
MVLQSAADKGCTRGLKVIGLLRIRPTSTKGLKSHRDATDKTLYERVEELKGAADKTQYERIEG